MDCLRDGFEEGKLLDGRFRTVSPLNHGSFGLVFVAEDTHTGEHVAIKCITKPDAVEPSACPAAMAIDERSEELDIHSRLALHSNIVNMIHHFETAAHQYMVLELCANGDLYEAIRVGKGPLETEHVRESMLQLVDAVQHLHSNGVYHRDIKPENVFVTASGSMKLGDFGLATTETWSTEFAVGSDRYMAPEQYDASVYGFGYSPAAADVWAIGIVLLNILFQRNPFASPTLKDPLFQDFARDRNSLFDVFPNMSQDTANVLVHSLALDPANRSLSALRSALEAVKTFTMDDEPLDDFYTDAEEHVPTATAAREPLRTPSVWSPTHTDYPWMQAPKSPEKDQSRQLSIVHDEEPELFPETAPSSKSFGYLDMDGASLSSNVDSGLGLSYKSVTSSKRASHLYGSLPISFTRPTNPSTITGQACSKSWSDLWDEEEMEKQTRSSSDYAVAVDSENAPEACTPQLSMIAEDDNSTPRQPLSEVDPNSRAVSPLRKLIEHDKANPRPVKQTRTSLLDKWAALGNFRRAKPTPPSKPSLSVTPSNVTAAPNKTKYVDAFASIASLGSNKKQKPSPVSPSEPVGRSRSWRNVSSQPLRALSMNNSRVWERKDHMPSQPTPSELWVRDDNWRAHKQLAAKATMNTSAAAASPMAVHDDAPGKPKKTFLDTEFEDDIGDLEWVGGWHDFN